MNNCIKSILFLFSFHGIFSPNLENYLSEVNALFKYSAYNIEESIIIIETLIEKPLQSNELESCKRLRNFLYELRNDTLNNDYHDDSFFGTRNKKLLLVIVHLFNLMQCCIDRTTLVPDMSKPQLQMQFALIISCFYLLYNIDCTNIQERKKIISQFLKTPAGTVITPLLSPDVFEMFNKN